MAKRRIGKVPLMVDLTITWRGLPWRFHFEVSHTELRDEPALDLDGADKYWMFDQGPAVAAGTVDANSEGWQGNQ